jgi:hypothetical protein
MLFSSSEFYENHAVQTMLYFWVEMKFFHLFYIFNLIWEKSQYSRGPQKFIQ